MTEKKILELRDLAEVGKVQFKERTVETQETTATLGQIAMKKFDEV